ncbi:hypothetical protein ACFQX6_52180 [Streptosporangium lutulentum]
MIRTLASAYVEPESYDVTVNAIGRDGAPVDAYAQVYDPKTGAIRDLGFQNGIAKIRLPKGEWNLYWEVIGRTTGVTIAHTTLEVDDADQQMTLDARQGKRVRITLDDPTAVRQPVIEAQMGYGPWTMGWTLWSSPTQPEKRSSPFPCARRDCATCSGPSGRARTSHRARTSTTSWTAGPTGFPKIPRTPSGSGTSRR